MALKRKNLLSILLAPALLLATCSAPPPSTPEPTQPPPTPAATATASPLPSLATQAPGGLSPPISPENAASVLPLMRLNADEPVSLVWSPRGDWLGVIASRDIMVFHPPAFDRDTGQTGEPAGATLQLVTTNPADVYLSPDGQWVGVLHPDKGRSPGTSQVETEALNRRTFAIRLWEVDSGMQKYTLAWREHAAPALHGAVFSPDWNSLAWYARGTVQFMDVRSGELGPAIKHEDFVQRVAFSADGDFFASAAAGAIGDQFQPLVLFWDVGDGEPLANLTGHAMSASRLKFSPDNRRLAAAAGDGSLVVWDLQTRELLATLYPESGEVQDFTFTPDGEYLVSVSSGGSARLWDLAVEQEMRAWEGLSTAVSPDGRLVALQPAAGPLQLVDIMADKKLSELEAPPGLVNLGFSPEGRLLAALTSERTSLFVWGSPP